MDKITKYLSAAGGYACMKDLRAAGFQARDVADLVVQGYIERVKPGLYRLAGHGESGKYRGIRSRPPPEQSKNGQKGFRH